MQPLESAESRQEHDRSRRNNRKGINTHVHTSIPLGKALYSILARIDQFETELRLRHIELEAEYQLNRSLSQELVIKTARGESQEGERKVGQGERLVSFSGANCKVSKVRNMHCIWSSRDI